LAFIDLQNLVCQACRDGFGAHRSAITNHFTVTHKFMLNLLDGIDNGALVCECCLCSPTLMCSFAISRINICAAGACASVEAGKVGGVPCVIDSIKCNMNWSICCILNVRLNSLWNSQYSSRVHYWPYGCPFDGSVCLLDVIP